MKKVFVKFISFLLIGLTVILSGCNGEPENNDEVIISVGGWPKKQGETLTRLETRKKLFEKMNPNVKVERDYWVFDRITFYAKAAGGQLPTVFGVGYTEMPEIITSGYSADLTDILKKRGYSGMFNEDILDKISQDGKIYGLPYGQYILGLAYNTELFQSAGLMEADGTPKQPKDWYEVVDFAVKIKESTGKPGFIFPTANNYGGWIFTSVAWSFGVDFIKKDADGKWKASFDTKEAVKALEFIKDLKWKYDILPKNNLIDGTEMYKLFANGSGAMLITSPDVAGNVVNLGMSPDQLGLMAMPKGPEKHVTLLGGGVYCVNNKASEAEIDAAVRWIEMANSFKLTDEYKETTVQMLESKTENKELIGIKGISQWSNNAESLLWYNKQVDKYANSNPNHIRLYNEFVENCPAQIRTEEPVCTQELYSVLDKCIQEVFVNENADCEKLIKNAAAEFQANYLDNI